MKRLILSLAVGTLAAGCSGGVQSDKLDAGIRIGPASGPTTEGGGESRFAVVLHSRPKSDVRLTFSVDDPAEAMLLTSSLTFTRVNWNAPQNVIVKGVDDEYADGHKQYNVVFDDVDSSDRAYLLLDPPTVPLTNVDDETPGVLVTSSSGTVTEAGDTMQVTLRLTARPTADVTVPVATSNANEATVFPATVTFAAATWSTPKVVTVTGEDDSAADGNKGVTISFGPATSADPAYEGVVVDAVGLTNLDDDIAAVFTTVTDGVSSEQGGAATVSVRLASQPAEAVTIPVSSSNTSEATLDVASLTFDDTDWNIPQTITATGANDSVTDGHQPFQIVFGEATSNDATYDGLVGAPVYLMNADDETASATVSPLLGLTGEGGDQTVVSVVLNSQPTADVTIPLQTNNPAEGVADVSSLTFTTMNWDQPQSVTVTGVRDIIADGHANYALVFGPATSVDPVYNGYVAPKVNLTNVDLGTGARVLLFDDANGSRADEAADALGMDVVTVSDDASFVSELGIGPYDVVIVEVSTLVLGTSAEAALADWVNGGGRTIVSYTGLDASATLQSALEVSTVPYTGWRNVFNNPFAEYSHFKGLQTLATVITGTTIVADSGNALVATNGAIVTTRLDSASGPSATAVTRDGRVIVNGFAFDDAVGSDEDGDSIPDVEELYQNQIARLFTVDRLDFNVPIPITDAEDAVVPFNLFSLMPLRTARVSLYITHTFDGDLDISLRAPDGTIVDISSDNGSSGDNFGAACDPESQRTTFRDDAAVAVNSGSAPFVGEYRPESPFSSLDGVDPTGSWEFRAADDGSGDQGTLHCWTLYLEY